MVSFKKNSAYCFAISLLLLINIPFAKAQIANPQVKQRLDSLKQVLVAPATHDTVKVATYLLIADIYYPGNLDTAKILCEKAEEISDKINYQEGLSGCYTWFGLLENIKGNRKEAIEYYLKSLKIQKATGNRPGQATNLHNMGVVYHESGDMTKALSYYYQSLAVRESIKDNMSIANSLLNIAAVMDSQNDKEKALSYYFRAMKLSREAGFENGIYYSFKGIATIYRNRFNDLAKRNASVDSVVMYKNKALYYSTESMRFNKENNNYKYYIGDLNSLGITTSLWSDYLQKKGILPDTLLALQNKALAYFRESLELAEQHKTYSSMAYSLQYIGNIYLRQDKIQEAEVYALKSMQIAKERKLPFNMKQTSELLCKIYEQQQRFKEALGMYRQFITMRDSLSNQETQKASLKKQYEYETGIKEQENLLLTQKNEIQQLEISRKEYLLYGLGCIIGLVLLVSFLVIRQGRIMNHQKTLKLEQRVLRSQMNPHFIFNSLIAIQSFIYKNEPKESGKYLASFAKLVRAILENSREEYITLSKEVQWLENYLNLQQLRFDGKFEYAVHIGEGLEMDTMIPPMLIQPSIENALEHGLKNIDYKGFIKVEFSKEDNFLVVRVKDNGVGISVSSVVMHEEEGTGKHTSLSTAITRERLQLLNRHKFRKIIFDIGPVEPKGTLITFSIPL